MVEALRTIARVLPFALRGLDTDNDSAFMNETLQNYCDQPRIEWTRSRAYRKNDQAWVEQKNGAVVRRLAGYGRLSGLAAAMRLAAFTRAQGFTSTSLAIRWLLTPTAAKLIIRPEMDRTAHTLGSLIWSVRYADNIPQRMSL